MLVVAKVALLSLELKRASDIEGVCEGAGVGCEGEKHRLALGGTCCFTGESLSDWGGVKLRVAANTSGMVRPPRANVDFDFVGDDGGVKHGDHPPLSRPRMKAQLRVLRGELGLLGESQPSVLMVLVGDNGGVL
jgi:hypothetical protein